MSRKEGTFLVTHVDEGSAVLRDVVDGQVHTLAEPVDLEDGALEAGEVLEATLEAEPPMEVTWTPVEIEERRRIELVDSDLEPTARAREAAADLATGELVELERAGSGEVHVLTVPDAERAAADVLEDEATVERAARLGAVRVEVRKGEGMVSVRYLPD